MVRTRFAPSPTGYMHIGNLRTALFSYLIAKSNNGKFILRIEDTDQKRQIDEAVNVIYNTLKQSKLIWDEGPDIDGEYGPYIQSQRKEIYLKYAEQLIKQGDAYYCFCPDNHINSESDNILESNNFIGYNGHCRNLSNEEIIKNLQENKPYVIRQKIPRDKKYIQFEDKVFGTVRIDTNVLDDQVLIKQDGYPTYNFANVIDDHLMSITHVVRGNEYISSTPKYVLLYQAFNWDIPIYIHLPLINGKDENGNISKLSKRHGSVSFQDLIKDGYLPEAIINYIAFLGWNPKTNQEYFTLEELEKEFKIENLNKSAAVFDYKKLDWFNSYYIKNMDLNNFISYGKKFLNNKDLLFNWELTAKYIKEKLIKFSDLNNMIEFLYNYKEYNKELFLNEKNKVDYNSAKKCLISLFNSIKNIGNCITIEDYNLILRKYVEDNSVKFGHVMWCFRIALSGLKNTFTGGFEIAEIIGYNEVLNRLQFSINILNQKNN